ncbi:MAG: LPS assembly lipoprotein LptE [Gemmatimonadaceae bacterium]
MRRFGSVSILLLLAASGCLYSFAGGGFPRHVRTAAVLPFTNETPAAELSREIHEALREALESRLGLRSAPENRAHAIVRGSVVKYETDVPVGFSADPSLASSARRQLAIAIDVSIVDQTSGRTLYERKGLSANGEYAERNEQAGRRQAIQRLVNDIVEGAQSQW